MNYAIESLRLDHYLAVFCTDLGSGGLGIPFGGEKHPRFFSLRAEHALVVVGNFYVATTFSADTPNLVTDIVRTNGVAGNWVWWAFLLTGMLTVFV